MNELRESAPFLVAMGILIIGSGFFSASEAAFFSLRARDRKKLSVGSRRQKLVVSLLADPDRLLSAVLFWNLVINVAYF
ncbi:MAG: CNNM domain-containing protein, partial [Planctomycetota bacterium]|nr:CNNM domain-containing protein [Planctomycetota bacterium]